MVERGGGGAFHEEDGGRAVADLGGVAGVDGAVFGEGGFDGGEGFWGDAWADPVIFVDEGECLDGFGFRVFPFDVFEWSDFLGEFAGLLGGEGFLVGRSGETVLIAAEDRAVFGHLFGKDAHGNFTVSGFGVGLKEVGEFGCCTGAVLRGHGFYACTDADFDHAAVDRVCDIDAGL